MIIQTKYFSIILSVLLFAAAVSAQTTEFTYQGRLVNGGVSVNTSHDFEFRLFREAAGGTALGSIQRLGVTVSNGVFTVSLDFGDEFNGDARFLEIAVKPAGSPNPFTVLSPRQPITSAPYSVRSSKATTADNAAFLGGVAANQFVQTFDTRLSDARNPLPNSANYIQNGSTQQTSSNFNISGNGTVGGTLSAATVSGSVVRATTRFDIGNNRVLTASSTTDNIFAGINAGTSNGFGSNNSYFGNDAGAANVSGGNNSFFGKSAGTANTASDNSFFGAEAGFGNTGGTRNSFFGLNAGRNNLNGNDNAFFGYRAGLNTTANDNSFFGSGSGDSNTTGTRNSFFGVSSGDNNLSGSDNSFFGYRAGKANTGGANSYFGSGAGILTTSGNSNSFFGFQAGGANTTGDGNTFVGNNAGNVNATGNFNTIIGWNANAASNNLSFATAIGAGAVVTENNTLVLGRQTDKVKMSVLQVTGGSDLAENFEISDEVTVGMIVAIDPNNAGKLILARGGYNRRVAGVVSGANNLSAGMILPNLDGTKSSLPVALSGRVWVYADATRRAIKPGDLLTTSDTTDGYAMKVTNYRRANGAIIGKAMTELKAGEKGLVLVLVSLQ